MRFNRNVNMLEGPLIGPIAQFAIPLIITSLLQLAFNAVDIIVVGKFAGDKSLAAVGATGPIINLLLNIFIGISIGASVLMGQYVGAKDFDNAKDTLHTSIAISFIGGVIVMVVGLLTSRLMLEMMGTPDEVIELSNLYLKIYLMGMPGFMVFNFGASLLRAIGDTKRPMYFLSIAGVFNVIANLVLVINFDMGVAGVAIGTLLSFYISAILIIISLLRSDGYMKLHFDKLRINLKKTLKMLEIGLPAGFQGALFSISNIMIQSGINSFGHVVMAANTAAGNIEGFVYMGMNSIYQTSLAFTAQNIGARKFDRVKKIFWTCLMVVTVVGCVLGMGAYLIGDDLLKFYTKDPEVIKYGLERLSIVSFYYFLCGIMDTSVGSLRGMGYSVTPMVVSLLAVCVLRVIWIYTIFRVYHTPTILYISYPVTWIVASLGHFITYKFGALKKLKRMELEGEGV